MKYVAYLQKFYME